MNAHAVQLHFDERTLLEKQTSLTFVKTLFSGINFDAYHAYCIISLKMDADN